MIKSETIGKLTEALSKVQAVLEGAKMDGANPFFHSKYSTLASVWDACRKPLSDNGLAIFQTAAFIPEHPEMVAIETTLSHSSGEFITGIMAAKPVKADPQSVGSCVTYLRRYSLAAICGVSPEDDDGNAATGKADSTNKHKKDDVPDFQPIQTHAKEEKTAPSPILTSNTANTDIISEAQGKRLYAISKTSEIPVDKLKLYLKHYYNIEHSKDIKKVNYLTICETVESKDKFALMMAAIPV